MTATAQCLSKPITLDDTRRRIEQWRDTRPYRHAPMPTTLWDAAVSAARQDGLYSTARRLRIDYGALKHHMERAGRGPALAAPTFVELAGEPPLTAADPVACVIDITGPTGSKRIRLRGLAPSDLMTLARMAWSEGQ